jgi:hypothetical protein
MLVYLKTAMRKEGFVEELSFRNAGESIKIRGPRSS